MLKALKNGIFREGGPRLAFVIKRISATAIIFGGLSSIHGNSYGPGFPHGGSGRYRNGMDVDCCSVVQQNPNQSRSFTQYVVTDRWNYCASRGLIVVWLADNAVVAMDWIRRAENGQHCVVY